LLYKFTYVLHKLALSLYSKPGIGKSRGCPEQANNAAEYSNTRS
jgi:hypothetical protein